MQGADNLHLVPARELFARSIIARLYDWYFSIVAIGSAWVLFDVAAGSIAIAVALVLDFAIGRVPMKKDKTLFGRLSEVVGLRLLNAALLAFLLATSANLYFFHARIELSSLTSFLQLFSLPISIRHAAAFDGVLNGALIYQYYSVNFLLTFLLCSGIRIYLQIYGLPPSSYRQPVSPSVALVGGSIGLLALYFFMYGVNVDLGIVGGPITGWRMDRSIVPAGFHALAGLTFPIPLVIFFYFKSLSVSRSC